MFIRKYFKQIAFMGLALVIFATSSNLVKAKRVTNTTYTYYSNNKVKTKKIVVREDSNNSLVRVEQLTYNANGTKKNLVATNYGAKNKRLVVARYKFKNNKKLKMKIAYYYNTHTKKKTPLTKSYAESLYNRNGKYVRTVYRSKSAKQKEIVKLAKKQVGKRYRYGGSSPKGFDCSGLTSYVYKKSVNKKIGRTSVSQSKKGKYVKISTKKLQPGDVLFWGSKSSPYHVGIYVGNGRYIHSSTPSTGVQYKKITSYKPSYAKRLV